MRHGTAIACFGFLVAAMPASGQQAHVNLDWNPHKNTQNLVPFGASLATTKSTSNKQLETGN